MQTNHELLSRLFFFWPWLSVSRFSSKQNICHDQDFNQNKPPNDQFGQFIPFFFTQAVDNIWHTARKDNGLIILF